MSPVNVVRDSGISSTFSSRLRAVTMISSSSVSCCAMTVWLVSKAPTGAANNVSASNADPNAEPVNMPMLRRTAGGMSVPADCRLHNIYLFICFPPLHTALIYPVPALSKRNETGGLDGLSCCILTIGIYRILRKVACFSAKLYLSACANVLKTLKLEKNRDKTWLFVQISLALRENCLNFESIGNYGGTL